MEFDLQGLAILVDDNPVALLQHLRERGVYLQDKFLVSGDSQHFALLGDERDGDFEVGLHLVKNVDIALQRLTLEQLVELG